MRRISRVTLIMVSAAALVSLGVPSAFAAAPTITSFTPTSGPTNCVMVVTGTAFTDFPGAQTAVDFMLGAVATPATHFVVISATEIWATVPALTPGNSYNIRVTNPAGTATSTGTFLSTSGAGACAPTVDSFVPDCAAAGTVVVIAGTNLLRDDGTTIVGGRVRFNPYSTDATHTIPDVDTATSLSVIVPSDATDGPVRVTTFAGGTVFSDTAFIVSSSCATLSIASFTPTSGPVGTSVVITGTGFTNVTSVSFNNVDATFTVDSDTQIMATVPVGATTGPIAVTTPGGTATSVTNFTVLEEPSPLPIEVFTQTNPDTCLAAGPNGQTAMQQELTLDAKSRVLVYFAFEWGRLSTQKVGHLSMGLEEPETEVPSEPWRFSGTVSTQTSGTVMWTFEDVATGPHTVHVFAYVTFRGTDAGTPSADVNGCALTVFVLPAA